MRERVAPRARTTTARRSPVLVALAAVLVTAACGGGGGGSGSGDPLAAPTATAKLDACPAMGHTDTLGQDLSPNAIAKLPLTYTFRRVAPDGCTPVRLNPCEPVHYVQNGAVAPAFVLDNVREAFRRLAQATGITFVDDGLTDEGARTGGYVPDRYGQRWAPILISWEHFSDAQTNGQQQVLGNTMYTVVDNVIVSARLRFNVDSYNNEETKAPIGDGFGPAAGSGTGPIGRENITWGRIVLHELAHMAGLGHNSDQGSLMYPDAAQQTIRPTTFSKSDLSGLRYLGTEAGCVPIPPLPTG